MYIRILERDCKAWISLWQSNLVSDPVPGGTWEEKIAFQHRCMKSITAIMLRAEKVEPTMVTQEDYYIEQGKHVFSNIVCIKSQEMFKGSLKPSEQDEHDAADKTDGECIENNEEKKAEKNEDHENAYSVYWFQLLIDAQPVVRSDQQS